jgi:aspartyl protease family protein
VSNPDDPWQRKQQPAPRHRVYIWLAVMLLLTFGVWSLFRLFPEVTLSNEDEPRFLRLVVLLALVSSGFVFSRNFALKESLRNIVMWCAIFGVLAIGYAYQDTLSDIGLRVRSELLPREPVAMDAHTLVLTESDDGSFLTTGEVDGVRVRFTIDTGASDIVLSPADAARAGIDMTALVYSQQTGTANGIGRGAPLRIASLSVGSVHLSDVAVLVNQAPMDTSLLGMSFLHRLKSFEVQGRRLFLHAS